MIVATRKKDDRGRHVIISGSNKENPDIQDLVYRLKQVGFVESHDSMISRPNRICFDYIFTDIITEAKFMKTYHKLKRVIEKEKGWRNNI